MSAPGQAEHVPALGKPILGWAILVQALIFLAALLLAAPPAARAGFTDVSPGFSEVFHGAVAWGDYDNDGDLDLAMAGNSFDGSLTRIYTNAGGASPFGTDSADYIELTGVNYCSLAWGDYDNDGDLDLAVAGRSISSIFTTRIYTNGGGDTPFGTSPGDYIELTGVYYGYLAWGDYDNDGDLDLAVAGDIGSATATTRIYTNAGGDTPFGTSPGDYIELTGVYSCSLAWGDYDNDGDLDLTVAGSAEPSIYTTRIYTNGGGDTPFGTSPGDYIELTGIHSCSLAWGDYDNDGDLDLAVAGDVGTAIATTRIYTNAGGDTPFGTSPGDYFELTGVRKCSLAWGDYDNDGDLDLAMAGRTPSGYSARIYTNAGGASPFGTDPADYVGLTGVGYVSLAWGDFDKDGYLDLMVTGVYEGDTLDPIANTYLYHNTGGWGAGSANTAPAPPTNVWHAVNPDSVTFTWNAGSDAETPAAGLSYNLMLGTSQGGVDVISPLSFTGGGNDGLRKVAALGPRRINSGLTVKGLPYGNYWWGVQAVDGALAGSTFATGSFILSDSPPTSGDFAASGDTDTPLQFTKEMFQAAYQDPDSNPLVSARVDSLPTHGGLTLGGSLVTTGQEIGYTYLDTLVFTPDAAWHGDATFAWSAFDGVAWSAESGSVNIGVGPPVVSTTSAIRNGARMFTSTGNVEQRGKAALTARGFVWSASPSPTLADHAVPAALGSGMGVFSTLVGVVGKGDIHIRAYATNAAGTSYGAEFTRSTMDMNLILTPILLPPTYTVNGSGGSETAIETGSPAAGGDGCGWTEPEDEEKKRRGLSQ